MQITYGHGKVSLNIPKANVAEFVTPSRVQSSTDVHGVLQSAMDASETDLASLSAEKRVALLMADHTRAQPHIPMLKCCLQKLQQAASVTVLIATGSHKPELAENLALVDEVRACAAALGIAELNVLVHDCENADFDILGTTPSGTLVAMNRAISDADVFVVNSDMKPHYFAGYSNGLKYFLPGTAAFESIRNNHSLALDPHSTFCRHPLHPDESRRDNPLAQDMYDYFRIAIGDRPVFGLVTIASRKEISWAGAGELCSVISKGIAEVDKLMAREVEPCSKVIVSCGGYPNDESLYTAQRALELTSNAYQPNAEILFLAECRNGVSPSPKAMTNFYQPLTLPLEETKKTIEQDYLLYAHKAYKFAVLIEHMKTIHLHSSLDDDMVRNIHLKPCADPQTLVDQWLNEDPDAKILVFDKANKLAIT